MSLSTGEKLDAILFVQAAIFGLLLVNGLAPVWYPRIALLGVFVVPFGVWLLLFGRVR